MTSRDQPTSQVTTCDFQVSGTASPDCRETARGGAKGVNGAAVLRQSHGVYGNEIPKPVPSPLSPQSACHQGPSPHLVRPGCPGGTQVGWFFGHWESERGIGQTIHSNSHVISVINHHKPVAKCCYPCPKSDVNCALGAAWSANANLDLPKA